MALEILPIMLDIAIGVATFVGLVSVPVAVFRKRIAAWWQPISNMGVTTERIETAVHNLQMELSLVSSAQRVMLDANVDVGTFETDAAGMNIAVNSTYARWLNVSKENLLGWRFLNYVHPDDQDRVREELALARQEVRPFRITHRVVTSGHQVFEVEKSGSPIPDPGVPVKWIGMVRKVNGSA